MASDLERQVAEATMPCGNQRHIVDGSPRTDDVCPDCHETNVVLRWPSLSQECDDCAGSGEFPQLAREPGSGLRRMHPETGETFLIPTSCPECSSDQEYGGLDVGGVRGPGRIPDVTLETALLAVALASVTFTVYADSIQCAMVIEDNDYAGEAVGNGSTYEDAACAALLAIGG